MSVSVFVCLYIEKNRVEDIYFYCEQEVISIGFAYCRSRE